MTAPGSRQKTSPSTMRADFARTLRTVGLVTVGAILVSHELFHFLADGLHEGYNNVLGAIWGPGTVGVGMHVALFLGLLWALSEALRSDRREAQAIREQTEE